MDNFPYEQIVEHCKSEYPKEACGLVIIYRGRYRYIPCKNIAGELATDEFCISTKDYSDAEDLGEVAAIVHSHPTRGASAGPTDIKSQARHGVDWLIVGLNSLTSTDFYWLKGEKKKTELYGRGYVWQIADCGTFIRDFYTQEFGIDIPDFYRPPKFWEQGIELYLNSYEEAGFYPIEFKELEYGDVILFALGSSITTHGAVYIGDNKIAHHLSGRLSCKDVLGSYYLDRATKFIRHRDMNNVKNNTPLRGVG